MGKKSGPPPPDYNALAQQQSAQQQQMLQQQTTANRANQTNPWGSLSWTQGPGGQWTQNVSLDPRMQGALDAQMGMQQQRSQAAQGLLGGVVNQLGQGVDTSGLTGWGGVPQAGTYGATTGAQMPQGGVDAARQQATDAMYGQATSRLDPRFAQQQSQLETQLANQGITRGSEAYSRAMDDLNRGKTDAYNQAMYSAIGAGGTEAQRAQQMQLGQEQQAFQQGLLGGAQGFGQQLQAGQFGNAQRLQQLQERLGLRQQDMGALDWLMNGQQVGMPQFGGYSQAGMGQAPDLMGAAQAGYNAQLEQQKNKNAGIGQLLGGAATIAGGIFGGPLGASLGGALGGMLGGGGGGGAPIPYNFGNVSGSNVYGYKGAGGF
jgi:hypothetical protein